MLTSQFQKKISYRITDEDANDGLTVVETVLKRRFGLTAKEISRLKFSETGILLKSRDDAVYRKVRINQMVFYGDEIRICMPERPSMQEKVPPVDGAIDILYEDEDFIAVNKPSGMVTHPGNGHHLDALANLVAGYCRKMEYDCSCKVIGRLDKETSGIVLFGKHRLAVSRIQDLMRTGKYEKTYLALAYWDSKEPADLNTEYRIHSAMGAVKGDLMKQEIQPPGEGKDAITHFSIRQIIQNTAFLEIRTETGRTHQIRVHLASEGHPLLGDRLYGMPPSAEMAKRTMLHAWKIRFVHPFSRNHVSITAPIPEDIERKI